MAASHIQAQASAVARRCLEELTSGGDWRSAADLLVNLAASVEPSEADAGSKTLFRDVVEPLADSFEPAWSEPYRDFFSWLLDSVRRRPGFEALDEGLTRVGVSSAEELSQRASAALRAPEIDRIRRIVVPSRVTLGADIAVVSVVLAGLRRRFPDASIVFVGGPKNLGLFAGAGYIDPKPAPYPRGGALRERLAVWPELLALVEMLRESSDDGNLLVVDPDSRMTQLGLLPLGPEGEHRVCYDSRAFGGSGAAPLAALTADWLDGALGPVEPPPLPWTSFAPRADLREGDRPAAAVSFGLGGNLAKRVSERFERDVLALLADRGYRIILDRGLGEAEYARTAALARQVEAAGGILHEGSFQSFGEIVAAAHLFVGYDSSFGHLAAAMGVPGVTVFAGAVSERMRQRWSPSGSGPSTVIPAGDDAEAVLAWVEEALP